jgi:hypothetical protein
VDDFKLRISKIDSNSIVRLIRGNKSRNTHAFFNEAAAALQFPLYFGENWNAFVDCLLDLEWMEGESYVILISSAADLLVEDEQDFRVLIDIFLRACDEWVEPNKYIPRERNPTAFHIVFQVEKDEELSFTQRMRDLNVEIVLI